MGWSLRVLSANLSTNLQENPPGGGNKCDNDDEVDNYDHINNENVYDDDDAYDDTNDIGNGDDNFEHPPTSKRLN